MSARLKYFVPVDPRTTAIVDGLVAETHIYGHQLNFSSLYRELDEKFPHFTQYPLKVGRDRSRAAGRVQFFRYAFGRCPASSVEGNGIIVGGLESHGRMLAIAGQPGDAFPGV